MKREPQNLILLLVGAGVAAVVASGAYTRYVKPAMLPWLIGSAAVLVALAIGAIIRDLRAGRAADGCEHNDRGRVVWLLGLPIVLLTLVVPPALNPRAAAPVTLTTTARPFPPLPAGHAPAVPLPEVLMRIASGSAGGLDDRVVSVTGFTIRDGDHVDLAKIVIVCCAADAQLARLHLTGTAASAAMALPDNSWVRAEGTVPRGQRYSGVSAIPVFAATGVTRIDPPSTTYG